MPLVLSRSDVRDLLDLDQAIACLEQAYVAQGHGQVTPWPAYLLRSDGSYLRVTSGGLAEAHRMGLRVTTAGSRATAVSLLFASPSGELLACMEYPFSDLRLSASIGVAIKHLAPPRELRVVVLGAGSTALQALAATATAAHVADVRVFSPHEESRLRFVQRAKSDLGLLVEPVDTPRSAVEEADVVLVSTNATTPALKGAWLPPGALVVASGARTEIDEDVFRRAQCLVTTSRVQELNVLEMTDRWPLARLLQSGELTRDQFAELGEIITGVRARPSHGITVFREAQGGFSDVALTGWVYEQALGAGRGTACNW